MSEPPVPGGSVPPAVILAGTGDAARRIAGLPWLLRTVLVLQRAGVTRCTVVGAEPPRDRRVRCSVMRADTLPAALSGGDARLGVWPGAVFDEALLRDLLAHAEPGRVVELVRHGARLRLGPGERLAATPDRTSAPRTGILEPADRPDAVLETCLIRGLRNPRDGWLDRTVGRRLSAPLTRLLVRTPLSPNAVTVLAILLGVVGGLTLGSPSPFGVAAGMTALLASSVLDCSDGEIARLRFEESRFGHALDLAGDTLVHLAVLGGIARGLVEAGTAPSWGTLGTLAAGVAGAFAVITACETTETRRRRLPCWENRLIDGVLAPLTTRDWYLFPVLFALAGRLDRLVPAAAVGAHVFWVVGLLALARVLRRA